MSISHVLATGVTGCRWVQGVGSRSINGCNMLVYSLLQRQLCAVSWGFNSSALSVNGKNVLQTRNYLKIIAKCITDSRTCKDFLMSNTKEGLRDIKEREDLLCILAQTWFCDLFISKPPQSIQGNPALYKCQNTACRNAHSFTSWTSSQCYLGMNPTFDRHHLIYPAIEGYPTDSEQCLPYW